MSQHDVPTVRVQREKSADNPSGIVVITESDLTADDVVVKDDAAPAVEQVAPATTKTEEQQSETSTEGKAKQPWEK